MSGRDSLVRPRRGEVWLARLDPTEGDEMRKSRPVVVVSSDSMGMLAVKIAAPLTTADLAVAAWRVPIRPTSRNGLDRPATVDLLQVRSLAVERFFRRLGLVTDDDMDQIAAALAAVIEYV